MMHCSIANEGDLAEVKPNDTCWIVKQNRGSRDVQNKITCFIGPDANVPIKLATIFVDFLSTKDYVVHFDDASIERRDAGYVNDDDNDEVVAPEGVNEPGWYSESGNEEYLLDRDAENGIFSAEYDQTEWVIVLEAGDDAEVTA